MSVINFPILYIPDPNVGRPLFNGQIYVGEPDLDPEIAANQKQLNVVQEDGTVVPVGQPFTLSAGGVPVYQGATVRLDVDGNYSLKILNANSAQTYYIHNVFEGQPITEDSLIGLAITTVDQPSDLLALDPALYEAGDVVFVTGWTGTEINGKHGNWEVDDGTGTDNEGTEKADAIWNAAGKRWLRVYDGDYIASWFSIVTGGATDQSTLIESARDSISALGGGTLVFTDGDYYTEDTVAFNTADISLRFSENARITYNGTKDRSALIIGISSSSTSNQRFENINVVDYDEAVGGSITNPFTDRDYVGVEFIRVKWCRVSINYVRGFTTNQRLNGASASGLGYNEFRWGRSLNAMYHRDFVSTATTGWINENLHLGGHFTNDSSYPDALSSWGDVWRHDGGDAGLNSNLFVKPAFEMGEGNVGVFRTAISFECNTIANEYQSIRAETGRGPVVQATDEDARANPVTIAFYDDGPGDIYTPLIEETNGAWGNTVTVVAHGFHEFHSEWPGPNVAENGFGVNATQVAVKGYLVQDSGSSTAAYSVNGEMYKDSVSFNASRGIGIFVDSSFHKQFVFTKTVKRGFSGRWRFVCYDEDGAIINTGDPIAGSLTVTGSATFGYSFGNGSDNSDRCVMTVTDDVKVVKVLCVGGTNRIDFVNLTVGTINGESQSPPIHTYTGETGAFTQMRVNADPDTALNGGYSLVGNTYVNYNATSGQPRDWVCTADGYNAAAWAISTSYRVGQLRNNDSGKVYVCVTAGTSAGSGGPTGTSSGITDNTVTWDYVGTLPTYLPGANL